MPSHEFALQAPGIRPASPDAMLPRFSMKSPIGIGLGLALEAINGRNKLAPEFLYRLYDKRSFLAYSDSIASGVRRIPADRLEDAAFAGLGRTFDQLDHNEDLRVTDIGRFRDLLSYNANSHRLFLTDSNGRSEQRNIPTLNRSGVGSDFPKDEYDELDRVVNLNPAMNLPFSVALVQQGDVSAARGFHIFIDALANYKFRALISFSEESLGSWSFVVRRFDENGAELNQGVDYPLVVDEFKEKLSQTWDLREGKGSVIGIDDRNVDPRLSVAIAPRVKIDTPNFVERLLIKYIRERDKTSDQITNEAFAEIGYRSPVRMDYFTFGQNIELEEREGRRAAA